MYTCMYMYMHVYVYVRCGVRVCERVCVRGGGPWKEGLRERERGVSEQDHCYT